MIAHIITSLTVASVLAHSMLGCCWHHDHDGSRADVAPVQTSHQIATASGDDRQHGLTAAVLAHEEDDPHEPCDEPDCTYVAARSVAAVTSLLAAAGPALPSTTCDGSQLSRPAVEHSASDVAAVPAERLRALHQVWLL